MSSYEQAPTNESEDKAFDDDCFEDEALDEKRESDREDDPEDDRKQADEPDGRSERVPLGKVTSKDEEIVEFELEEKEGISTKCRDFWTKIRFGRVSWKWYLPAMALVYGIFFLLLAYALYNTNKRSGPKEEPSMPSMEIGGNTGYVNNGVSMCAPGWYQNATTCYGICSSKYSNQEAVDLCKTYNATLLQVDDGKEDLSFLPLPSPTYWVMYGDGCKGYEVSSKTYKTYECSDQYPTVCTRGLL